MWMAVLSSIILQAKRLERKEAGTLNTSDDPVRSSLAVLSVQNKSRQQQPANVAAAAFALARPKRKAASNPGKENAGGLEVFVDDEFKAGRAGIKPSPVVPVSGLWNKLGGFEQNRYMHTHHRTTKFSNIRFAFTRLMSGAESHGQAGFKISVSKRCFLLQEGKCAEGGQVV